MAVFICTIPAYPPSLAFLCSFSHQISTHHRSYYSTPSNIVSVDSVGASLLLWVAGFLHSIVGSLSGCLNLVPCFRALREKWRTCLSPSRIPSDYFLRHKRCHPWFYCVQLYREKIAFSATNPLLQASASRDHRHADLVSLLLIYPC